MSRHTNTEQDYIKACRKGDREREISTHGKIISTIPTKVHSPKNEYKRSKNKRIILDNYD